MMSPLWSTLTMTLMLAVSCQSRSTSNEDEKDIIKHIMGERDDLDASQLNSRNDYVSGHDSASHSDASVEGLSLPSYAWGHVPSLRYRDQDLDDLDRSELRLIKGHHHRPSYAGLLAQLRGESRGLPLEEGIEKRLKPSGFQGSRGKRFIPGLEKLLLASYYQGAEKRQPPLGFHGSRG